MTAAPRRLDPGIVVNSLSAAVAVLDGDDRFVFLNSAGEALFAASEQHLLGQKLDELIPRDNPIFGLIGQARDDGAVISEYGMALESPRIGRHFVNIQAAPLPEIPGLVALTLHERSLADKIARQLTHRSAARSVTALASMLAHEVKNPLSGIRGAAQLLEQGASDEDKTLTQLICDETDRICALVDRMDVFSDSRPLDRGPVNIHRVLEHVRMLAEKGFGRHVIFVEDYDPSLPPVFGNRDQLIQVFLNLIKNASEAVADGGGEVMLSTAYQHGIRLALPGSSARVNLPLVVTVQDNGPGIPDELRPYLFDPFVTTKSSGSGLGLALVAKIVEDHGGAVEFESQPGRTLFRIMLPVAPQGWDDDKQSEEGP